jgi:Cu(I)/Ag(I) efflux system membrane fusion protein
MNRQKTMNRITQTSLDEQSKVQKPSPPRGQPSRGRSRTLTLLIVMGVVGIGGVILSIWNFRNHADEAAHTHEPGSVQYWTCGMHPWVILPEPGDCPICGMDLVPLDPDKFKGEIAISPVVVQNMGVRIEEVTTGPLVKTIRTVGIVDYDEETVRDVNTKVSGWIEKLYVDSLGATVEKDEPLFSLYSPQLFSAQEDYLIAARGGSSRSGSSLREAARIRLEYFDITAEQIETLRRAGKPQKALDVGSPFSGVVIAKHANEGMKIEPGMQVYRIADLSKVWVLVTVYEYQLPYVKEGQDAVMTLPYVPGVKFEGKVVYVYPYLDKKTREVQVRLEFDNSDGLLKPGMYANVELRNTLAAVKTLVPRSAVIDTGARQVAFVSQGEGRFEPRNVETGVSTDDGNVEVLSGLKPGEMVVTSGQFLLDSEANTREALAKMVTGEPAAEQKAEEEQKGASELTALPELLAAELSKALDEYFVIQDALASDAMDGVGEAAGALADAIKAMQKVTLPDRPHFWHQLSDPLATLERESAAVAKANDIAAMRLAFGNLSVAFRKLVKATGIPAGYPNDVLALHCPMYLEDQGGAVWLQVSDEVRNPYMGSAMPGCFDERTAVPVTGVSGK